MKKYILTCASILAALQFGACVSAVEKTATAADTAAAMNIAEPPVVIDSAQHKIIEEFAKKNNMKGSFTKTGLYAEIVEPGEGAGNPNVSNSITIDYKGTTLDGKVFDQTKEGAPATFPLSNLISGWKEGIPMLKKGGKIKLVIPSALGYGSAGAGASIPPNAVLYFEIKLHDFK